MNYKMKGTTSCLEINPRCIKFLNIYYLKHLGENARKSNVFWIRKDALKKKLKMVTLKKVVNCIDKGI